MINYIYLTCNCDYYKLINKLDYLNINVYCIKKINNKLFFKIKEEDYSKLKKYLPHYQFNIIKETGFKGLKKQFNNSYYYFLALLCAFLILLFLSNIIVKVEVIHSSKKVRDLVYDALDEEGIRRLTLKKDFKEITKIKERILNKYPKDLEWLEIEVHGMKYVIRVEQRIITKPTKLKSSCNIIAKKSGIITDITTRKGEALVARGNYVNKGDLLISGNISFNNEIKNTVCASGSVKAEVWYTVKVSLPLNYQVTKKTNKKRYNIVYDKGLGKIPLFKNKWQNYSIHDYKIISLFNTNIYFRTIKKNNIIKKKYNKDEALNKAMLIALEKINIQKKDQDRIITQKVLKKELNDSTINLEIFFAVSEEIGEEEEIINSNEVE